MACVVEDTGAGAVGSLGVVVTGAAGVSLGVVAVSVLVAAGGEETDAGVSAGVVVAAGVSAGGGLGGWPVAAGGSSVDSVVTSVTGGALGATGLVTGGVVTVARGVAVVEGEVEAGTTGTFLCSAVAARWWAACVLAAATLRAGSRTPELIGCGRACTTTGSSTVRAAGTYAEALLACA